MVTRMYRRPGCEPQIYRPQPTGGQSQLPGDGRNQLVLTEVRGPPLPKRRAYSLMGQVVKQSFSIFAGILCKRGTSPKPPHSSVIMEGNPMRYIVSLDFWLCTAIGLCLSSMAVAVQPIYW